MITEEDFVWPADEVVSVSHRGGRDLRDRTPAVLEALEDQLDELLDIRDGLWMKSQETALTDHEDSILAYTSKRCEELSERVQALAKHLGV